MSQKKENEKRKQKEHKKNEFVSLASHQLRTPLTSIKLYAEMLDNGSLGDLNEAQREVLKNIEVANERMIQLVDNLLQLSHIQEGELNVQPEQVDLRELVADVIEDSRIMASARNIKIHFSYKEDLEPATVTDPQLLTQILNNLVRNAIQYSGSSPEGEEKNIVITITHHYTEGEKIHIIGVKDEGIGIPKDPAVREKIFEKFYRAPNAQRMEEAGDGLGLYMCKEFIHRLNGRIWFESKEGKGSTFCIAFPSLT